MIIVIDKYCHDRAIGHAALFGQSERFAVEAGGAQHVTMVIRHVHRAVRHCLCAQDAVFDEESDEACGVGQEIMIKSFRTIEGMLRHDDWPLGHKWALLHAIHTTADFEMERILYTDPGAVETLYGKLRDGVVNTIVTDVTMAASGIRKGALERLGVTVKCYLTDERTATLAKEKEITRTQAGIRLAVEEHPDALFVFGNAPTALMELCELIRKGKAHPGGVIAAPVGFVHVRESKHMVKPFTGIPKLIVEGRKGGSNLAATLTNAILTFDDAAQLKPGRDV